MTVRTAATARFAAHVRTPLYREGYALVLSAGLASALGLVYWIIAARTYSPSVVGLNAAAISAMLLLSGIAQLNLSSALTRFVPDAGRATWRLVAGSYAISIVASAAAAAVFLAGLDLWAPRLGFLRSSVGFALWLIAATTVWSVFTLQDSVLTGLRHAIWVPVDNTLYAVAKIGLLAIFATTFPRYGILASWTLGVLFSLVLINGLLAVRLIPAHAGLPARSRRPATARQIGRFVAADYLGGLFWLASSTLIPIAVTQRLGGSANAFFTLAWVMTMPLYLASANIGNSLVVSVVTDRERLADYSRRVFAQTARIVVPAALGVALAAPFILRLIGEEYARQATPVLRLLALSAIPNMISVLYLSVWRARATSVTPHLGSSRAMHLCDCGEPRVARPLWDPRTRDRVDRRADVPCRRALRPLARCLDRNRRATAAPCPRPLRLSERRCGQRAPDARAVREGAAEPRATCRRCKGSRRVDHHPAGRQVELGLGTSKGRPDRDRQDRGVRRPSGRLRPRGSQACGFCRRRTGSGLVKRPRCAVSPRTLGSVTGARWCPGCST